MEEYAPGTEIMEVVLVGSRARGLEREDSDMDFVIEYEGEMKEDEMFNLLNQEGMVLAGIKIDLNPIRLEQSGLLEDYLLNAESYLSVKERDNEENRQLIKSKEKTLAEKLKEIKVPNIKTPKL